MRLALFFFLSFNHPACKSCLFFTLLHISIASSLFFSFVIMLFCHVKNAQSKAIKHLKRFKWHWLMNWIWLGKLWAYPLRCSLLRLFRNITVLKQPIQILFSESAHSHQTRQARSYVKSCISVEQPATLHITRIQWKGFKKQLKRLFYSKTSLQHKQTK